MKTGLIKIKDALGKLNFILSAEQKRYGVWMLILSLLAAVFEMVGVSVILPLMQVMLKPDDLWDRWYVRRVTEVLHIETNEGLVFLICTVVILVYIVKNVYFIFYSYVTTRYANKIKKELSVRVLEAYMQQGYLFFVNHNSGRLLQGMGGDVSSVYTIVSQLFSLISKGLTIVCIGVFILVQTPALALCLVALVVLCFVLIQLIFRKSMRKYGELQRRYSWYSQQISLESIQGSKEILVMNRQKHFVSMFRKNTDKLNAASLRVDMGARTPTYIIETICITGLLLIVGVMYGKTNDTVELISQLSAIAIAAFRILPSLGGISSAVNSIMFNMPALSAAYETLSQVKELEKEFTLQEKTDSEHMQHVNFQDKLELKNIVFSYPNAEVRVLDGVNITIKRGQAVAFIGPSGAGKTTLSDVVLALLEPQAGQILMDGINIQELGTRWNHLVGYVPQSVYLIDNSVRNNVAFGYSEEEIDDEKVWKALEMAQIKDFVETLPEGLDTFVGEFGVRFSGGQRQRMAIARALYSNPDILILDEATSALDNDTENAVMEAIDALQGIKTLIIVAHRLSTIRNCDVIYEIKDGKATERSKKEIFPEG
jgi:ABC-type multidrug transport system fused ATPase/permease subunit